MGHETRYRDVGNGRRTREAAGREPDRHHDHRGDDPDQDAVRDGRANEERFPVRPVGHGSAATRDRSNVDRSLSTLREKGLAGRERRLLEGGGRVYQCSATPLEEARDPMHETLDAWTAYVHDRFDSFGDVEFPAE